MRSQPIAEEMVARRPRLPRPTEEDRDREEDFSAQESPPQAHPWLPEPHEDPAGPSGDLPPSQQGPQAPLRVTSGLEGEDRPAGTPSAVRTERLTRRDRLRQRRDYQRCYRRGRRRSGAHLILYVAENGLGSPRLGTTLSRKVGNSVVRHRIKRRLREIYRRSEVRAVLPAVDIVVHVRPGCGDLDFADLRRELESLLAEVCRPRGRSRRR